MCESWFRCEHGRGDSRPARDPVTAPPVTDDAIAAGCSEDGGGTQRLEERVRRGKRSQQVRRGEPRWRTEPRQRRRRADSDGSGSEFGPAGLRGSGPPREPRRPGPGEQDLGLRAAAPQTHAHGAAAVPHPQEEQGDQRCAPKPTCCLGLVFMTTPGPLGPPRCVSGRLVVLVDVLLCYWTSCCYL